MHDDRIAGVTFEENASRNALIVNEECAWVGNPFSAPEGVRKEPDRKQRALYVIDMQGFFFYSPTPVEAKDGNPFTLSSWLFCPDRKQTAI